MSTRKPATAKTETYTTSDWDDGKKDAPDDPIIALCEMPGKRVHVLDEIRNCYGPKKWISVGACSTSDIRLTERLRAGQRRRISRRHCRLCRTLHGRILVEPHEDSTNHTKVNRVRLHGLVELTPGDVLEVGRIRLIGLTAEGVHHIKITADYPRDYVNRVTELLGTLEKAAAFFGVHLSTVSRWRRKGGFRA